MIATTNISMSKEEWLEKIENAKRLLDSYEKADRRYLIDEILLNRLFEIATTAIPIEWLEKKVDEYINLGLNSVAKELRTIIYEWEEKNVQLVYTSEQRL